MGRKGGTVLRSIPWLASIVCAMVASGLVSCAAADDTDPIHITLLGINDFHGALLDRPAGSTDDAPRKGGAAMMSAYVQAVRAENPGGTLLLDAGDMLQGPLLCNHNEGAAVADVYRHLGVAAAAVGNHEFDYGPVGPKTAAEPGDDARGALAAFAERSGVALLAANIRALEGELPAGIRSHLLVEVAGVQVGIVGLATADTPNVTLQDNVVGLTFDPVGPALAAEIEAVRAAGAEVIVALGHLDGGCRNDRRWPPVVDCEQEGELIEVLQAADGEADAVLLGHRHAWITAAVDGVAVVEGGSRGRGLSRVDLYVDPATRRVVRSSTRIADPIALCEMAPATGNTCFDPAAQGPWTPASYGGRPVPPDPEVDAILAPYRAQVAELCSEPLAVAAAPITRRGAPSAAGILVSDAMLAYFPETDLAMLNSGALRASLPAGNLSYCEIYALFPFDNRFVELTLDGDRMTRLLEVATSGARSLPLISGMDLEVIEQGGEERDLDGDGQCEAWEIDRLVSARDLEGREIDPDATYRVVMPDFLFHRTDDMQPLFAELPAERQTLHADKIRDAVVRYLRGIEAPLGVDGGWPLPQADQPRIRVRSE